MRKIFAFHGGLQLPANKHQSVRTPIAAAGIPPELVIPLSQHIGAPADPVVAVGKHVLKGQLIAAARGLVSAPLHAPTSGAIRDIGDRLIAHHSGQAAPCIVIATDGRDEWVELNSTADYRALDKADLIQRIRDAGIAGMGGAGYPSAAKLSVVPDVPVDTLIINGTECEPYTTADDSLMRERALQVVEGVNILRHIIAPKETLIAVEDNMPEALESLRSAARGTDIEIIAIPTRYPSGGEKQLIEILTGKQVPSGALTHHIGVICKNVGTAAAIYDAVVRGRPLISRITTVTGASVREPQNFEVLIGTPARYLLEKAGYQSDINNRLIVGGPMTGYTLPTAEVPIVKTTHCLLAPTATEMPTPPPALACIRCGQCEQVCPVSLLPQQLFWFAQGREIEKLERHNLFDCIECGACSYVCPSHIPLVQYYRASKADILQLRRDHDMAEQSRLRFEAHQQRLERAGAEKAARRAARKTAAEQRVQMPDASGEEDPIQAAIARAKAKKAAQQAGAQNELEKLEKTVVSTHQRLDAATAKLAQAQAEGSDVVEALQNAVDNTRSKLTAAEQALRNYHLSRGAALATRPPIDTARAAIEKAVAARAAEAALSPREKARIDLEKLQQRLQKSQDMLNNCRLNGEENKVIVALELTVERLTQKISAAQQTLNTAEDA